MPKLSELRPNQRARIVSVAHEGPSAGRLWALGVMPGVDVRLVGVAPLGDPLLVQMHGSRLSLRREEAEKLTVETHA
jgi:ferrous iron transport protein A